MFAYQECTTPVTFAYRMFHRDYTPYPAGGIPESHNNWSWDGSLPFLLPSARVVDSEDFLEGGWYPPGELIDYDTEWHAYLDPGEAAHKFEIWTAVPRRSCRLYLLQRIADQPVGIGPTSEDAGLVFSPTWAVVRELVGLAGV